MAFAHRALDWLSANLAQFDPDDGGAPPDLYREKALAELAMLCIYLDGVPLEPSGSGVLHESLSFIGAVFARPSYRERLLRFEDEFIQLMYPAVALHRAGLLEDRHLWRGIEGLVRKGGVCASERPPHRTLELRRLLDLGGFSHPLPAIETLCGGSILNRPLNVFHLTDRDIYSITHSVFYLTGMGSHPLAGLSGYRVGQLRTVIDQLLGAQTRRGNWDLVGELLLSASLLGHTGSILYRVGWEMMLEAQRPDGAVPGTSEESLALSRGKSATPRRIFEQCYHTTLVAAFAGALCRETAGS